MASQSATVQQVVSNGTSSIERKIEGRSALHRSAQAGAPRTSVEPVVNCCLRKGKQFLWGVGPCVLVLVRTTGASTTTPSRRIIVQWPRPSTGWAGLASLLYLRPYGIITLAVFNDQCHMVWPADKGKHSVSHFGCSNTEKAANYNRRVPPA